MCAPPTGFLPVEGEACTKFPSVRCMPASSSRDISASPPAARRWCGWSSGSGYVHKGIELLMAGATIEKAARLAARTSGDSTVAYGIAFAHAVEAALNAEAPPRAHYLRALMAELERLANHFGDIGAICNDASFSLMHAHCGILREQVLRAADACFGHRLMMDRVVPGGVANDLTPDGAARIREAAAEIRARFPRLVELYDNTTSLQDRTVGTGIVTRRRWRGSSARPAMSAAPADAISTRGKHPATRPTIELDFVVPVLTEGDVNARVWLRIREVEQSLALIEQIIARLPAGPIAAALDARHRRRIGLCRRFPRRCAGLGAARWRAYRALPSARSIVVSVAAARGGDRGQHRRRLPALQQIVQLLVFGA